METTHKQQVTITSIIPNFNGIINTYRWFVHWEEVNNPHGDTSSGTKVVGAKDELGALLAFRRWVVDSNRGWEVVP